MIVALDYDETYTRDPMTWRRVVRTLKDAGHTVHVVTMRHEHEVSSICPLLRSMVSIIPTGRQAKRPHCEKMGIMIDIWIDDSPHWVDNSIPQ